MRVAMLALALATAAPSLAFTVSLGASLPSPQRVGTEVTLTATVSGISPTDVRYRFDVRPVNDPTWRMLADFHYKNKFTWATPDEDGYVLRVVAEEIATGVREVGLTTFALFSPGAVLGNVVAYGTAHPLVAVLSSPPCTPGSLLRVRFWAQQDGPPGQTTHFKPCRAGKGVNHYVGGMRQSTVYAMRAEIFNGATVQPGGFTAFTTGTLNNLIVDWAIADPVDPATSTADAVHLATFTADRTDGEYFIATDLNGEAIWSYGAREGELDPDDGNLTRALLGRPLPGGRFAVLLTERGQELRQVLAEIDLTGNIVRETNVDQVNRQLAAFGVPETINDFHHEAFRLPNGHTAVLAAGERIVVGAQPANYIGDPRCSSTDEENVNVYGDLVIVLDANFAVVWVWNAFDHLDVNEPAILGEICTSGGPGCPPLILGDCANDWLHMNATTYSPADGNLVLSARHKDAVYKINYANGAGDGSVVWELGEYGDFTLIGADGEAWPWFSHQHDSHYDGPVMTIYDNGNTRQDALGGQNSRGQVYVLDESTMTAGLLHNFDLGVYAQAVGSGERLTNGNFMFDSGFIGAPPNNTSQSLEVTPDGTSSWRLDTGVGIYRAWRVKSLYAP